MPRSWIASRNPTDLLNRGTCRVEESIDAGDRCVEGQPTAQVIGGPGRSGARNVANEPRLVARYCTAVDDNPRRSAAADPSEFSRDACRYPPRAEKCGGRIPDDHGFTARPVPRRSRAQRRVEPQVPENIDIAVQLRVLSSQLVAIDLASSQR